MKELPNELLVQLDGQKPFDQMTKKEQIVEVKFCLWRTEQNLSDELDDFTPDKKRIKYYKSQIRLLTRLKEKINKEQCQ